MARTPWIPQLPATADEAQPCLPLPPYPPSPLIPLQAVWASLTPPQQQQLFHQLVCLCCGLLRPRAARSHTEDAYDTL
jgi:hypothetical protein